MNAIDQKMFAHNPGELVAAIDPNDLKAAWTYFEEARVHSEQTGGQAATGIGLLKKVCKPGCDLEAVSYRAMMVGLLNRHAKSELAPWKKEGQLADAVFRVAARIPMEWIGVGVTRQGFPFDLEEFERRLQSEERDD